MRIEDNGNELIGRNALLGRDNNAEFFFFVCLLGRRRRGQIIVQIFVCNQMFAHLLKARVCRRSLAAYLEHAARYTLGIFFLFFFFLPSDRLRDISALVFIFLENYGSRLLAETVCFTVFKLRRDTGGFSRTAGKFKILPDLPRDIFPCFGLKSTKKLCSTRKC